VEALFRDAIHHRIVFIAENLNLLSNQDLEALVREGAMAELMQAHEKMDRQAQAAEMIRAGLEKAIEHKDKGMFAEVLAIGDKLIASCDEPWKSTIQTLCKAYRETLHFD
jgi:hypothetical protein